MFMVGLAGCGRWGPNLLRNFHSHEHFEVLWACDCEGQRLERIREQYDIETGQDVEDMLERHPVDVLVVATPVHTHFEVARLALRRGCHVFIEKPLAASSAECVLLLEEAERCQRLLFVDFTYLFHPDIGFIKEQVDSGCLGERLLSYTSVRSNWGPVRRDINAIGDLAVHDLAILQHLVSAQPLAVSAVGSSFVPGEPVNQAFVELVYPEGFLAHISVNWLAPYKMRRITLCGETCTIDYDELAPQHRISLYDYRLPHPDELPSIDELHRGKRFLVSERAGLEPLRGAVEAFYAHLRSGQTASRNNSLALRVARILDAANLSLEQRGIPIYL